MKLPLYAREGVAEVWIVDRKGKAVELHRQPSPTGYALTERKRRGDMVTVEGIPGLQFAVQEILG